jgi:hypothetical protein
MPEQETEESIEELRLQLEYAQGELNAWKGRARAAAEETHRTKMLLEVAETKFQNLQKILDRYPLGKTAREIALQLAVQLSGPLDQDDILRTAIRFEAWLLNSADDE